MLIQKACKTDAIMLQARRVTRHPAQNLRSKSIKTNLSKSVMYAMAISAYRFQNDPKTGLNRRWLVKNTIKSTELKVIFQFILKTVSASCCSNDAVSICDKARRCEC